MVIVAVGVELLEFCAIIVTVGTMEQGQKMDVKVREFSTNQDKSQFNFIIHPMLAWRNALNWPGYPQS